MRATLQIMVLAIAFAAPYVLLRHSADNPAPDKNFSSAFKGIATLLILYHHVRIWFPEQYWFLLHGGEAYFGVSLFYFISGVGLAKSYTQKQYTILSYCKKRALAIFPVTITCGVMTFIFHPLVTEMNGSLSVARLLGLSNWFIISILVWYIAFIICVKLSNNKHEFILYIWAASLIILATLFYFHDTSKTAQLWIRFPFSFALGVSSASFLDTVLLFSKRKTTLILVMASCFLWAVLSIGSNTYLALVVMDCASIAVFVSLLSLLISFAWNSRLLMFLGNNSLPIYLLQVPLLKYGTIPTAWRSDVIGLLAVLILLFASSVLANKMAAGLRNALQRLGVHLVGSKLPANQPPVL